MELRNLNFLLSSTHLWPMQSLILCLCDDFSDTNSNYSEWCKPRRLLGCVTLLFFCPHWHFGVCLVFIPALCCESLSIGPRIEVRPRGGCLMESCYSFISAWLIDAHEEATFTPHLPSLRARRIQSHGKDRASIWTGVSHGDARGGRQAGTRSLRLNHKVCR